MLTALLLAACSAQLGHDSAPHPAVGTVHAPPPDTPNVLLVVVDDLGVDKVGALGAHPRPASTPNIDALFSRGLRFDQAYSTPSCSPTRAALLTGRQGRRTGIGSVIRMLEHEAGLPRTEVTLPEMLSRAPESWESLYVGKWHLSVVADPDVAADPNLQGFDHYVGGLDNLTVSHEPVEDASYTRWLKTVDGVSAVTETYATTDEVDEALARIPSLAEPWLSVVSFHAPHSPFHLPPRALTPTTPRDVGRPSRPKAAHAMIEALDTELGRLLWGLDAELLERTLVVFVSDNGTSADAMLPPWDPERAKLSLYDGGCRVPMVVAGPGVSPGRTDALTHVVDLFPTIADFAGVDLAEVVDSEGLPVVLDGVSLRPVLADPEASVREYVYSERFRPNGGPAPDDVDDQMIRDGRYKLMRRVGVETLFFEYGADRWSEGPDLLPGGLTPEQWIAHDRLLAELDARVAEMESAW